MVLGASGFVGSAVLDAACASAAEQIYAPVHRRPLALANDPRIVTWKSSLQDLQFPSPLPDYIIHAARQASSKGRMGRLFRALLGQQANSRLLQTYNNPGIISKLWYVSGSLMYGNGGQELITEDRPLQPISFARDYRHAEAPFTHAATSGSKVGIFRVPWVFGTGSWFERFYLQPMRQQGYIPLFGKGDNIITLISRQDLGRAILTATASTQPVLNLFMPDYITQETFAGLLHEYSGLPVQRIALAAVRQEYGAAVADAFSSSIRLGSLYDNTAVQSSLQFHTAQDMIAGLLPAILDI